MLFPTVKYGVIALLEPLGHNREEDKPRRPAYVRCDRYGPFRESVTNGLWSRIGHLAEMLRECTDYMGGAAAVVLKSCLL